jgi:hypothetical protein
MLILMHSYTVKSRRIRCAGHLARTGERECIQDMGGKARRKETTRKTKAQVGVDWIDPA